MAHADSRHGAAEAPASPDKSVEQASLMGTLAHLWPYIWPGDRADLKARVVLSLIQISPCRRAI